MNLFTFLAFLIVLLAVFIIGFAWGVWKGSRNTVKTLIKNGYTIVPPKEDT